MCKTMVRCAVCGEMFSKEECRKVKSPKTHYEYVCEEHHELMYGYFNSEVGSGNEYELMMKLKGIMEENGFKKSVAKKISITTGFEFEVGRGVNEELARILMTYGYMRTHDGTVQAEYKSPIYRNLNGIAKLLYSVVENGMGSIGRGAGTHVNVWSEELDSKDWKRIQRRYNTIFRPLYEAIRNDSNHAELFGRHMSDTDGYADGFGLHHCTVINMEDGKEDSPRIEFRLCKYDNNTQFMNCLKFCNECMKTILVNYSRNFITDTEATRKGMTTEEATKHNEHKARITANKLVKVYNKYRGL